MLPSPFARLFGMVSAPFDNEQYRNQGNKATEKRNRYQKVIICPLGAAPPYLCLWRRNFYAAGGVLLWLQRCDFGTAENPFLLTTAAQNMRDLRRKLLSLGNHFFERLKTANFSTACGTSTLKSLLLLGSNAPHVHLRLRKRLTRCTLWRRNFCAANFPFSTASNMRHLCRF